MSDSDAVEDLVARAMEGDENAWRAIVDRYAALVWSVCRSFHLTDADAADVSQFVWLRTVESLARLRVPAALPGWLVTTTRNECLRVVSGSRRSPSAAGVLLETRADAEAPVLEDVILAAEERAALREGFAQLPEHCRQLLLLLMSEEHPSYAQIGAALDMPIGSIGPTRSRCLQKLRDCPALATWANS